MFETIFSILRSNLQPWLKINMQDDRYYQQLLINKEMIDCEHPVFQIEMRDVPYYPPMVLYYQRIIHNNINDWLNNQWADRYMDMTSDRAYYRYTNLMNIFDELLSHTDKIIQRQNYSMRSVSGDEVSFNTDTNEKICTLICYNLQAILIVAFLTWLDYYKDLLPQELLFDSPKQLAFSLIKHDLPKNIEITRREKENPIESNNADKFYYILSDSPEDIRYIEEYIIKCMRENNVSELCRYLKNNEGTYFRTFPLKADVVYNELTTRWGDEIAIKKDSFRTIFSRIFK